MRVNKESFGKRLLNFYTTWRCAIFSMFREDGISWIPRNCTATVLNRLLKPWQSDSDGKLAHGFNGPTHRHQLFNQNSVISAWSQGTRWQLPRCGVPNYFWPFIEAITPFESSKEFKPQGFSFCFAGHWVLQSNGNWLCCCRDLPKAWHFEKKNMSILYLAGKLHILHIFS